MKTVRQKIVALLTKDPMTIRQLAAELDLREKEVGEHMVHIQKSLKGKNKKLTATTACCEACGFTFKDRKKLMPPGRCPNCKAQRIIPQVFSVSE